jgi:hypothetical protein
VIKRKRQGKHICLSYQLLQRGGYNEHQHAKKSAIYQVLSETPKVSETQWISAKNH